MPSKPQRATMAGWRHSILQYIADHPDRLLKARALARELRVPDERYAEYRECVRDMLESGEIVLGPGRRVELPELANTVVGVFRGNQRGFGFVEVPNRPDLFIPRGRTAEALEGDTVSVRVLKARQHRAEPSGEVVRILERAPQRWVGTLELVGRRWVVRPQGKAPAPLIEIGDPGAKAAQPGDLVVVEPLGHSGNARSARGVIVERLGPPSETQAKILAVIRRLAIPDQFSADVRAAAQKAAQTFDPDKLDEREDLRHLLTITIDPVDARDFDDAISIEPQDDGTTRLGVHIADVSHFVPEGSAIDREARLRGTSVYFPGFVVPMLPEVLSNGVCSLQPGETRLTKSVFITYDRAAEIVAARCASGVIRSRARLAYEQASAALEGKPGEIDSTVLALLREADSLARRIRKRRLARGMISLTVPEIELKLGRDGRVESAGPADTSFSHTIIEMFMVEANEAASRTLTDAGLAHLRRIHPPPPGDGSDALRPLTTLLRDARPRALDRSTIRALLDSVRGKPEEMAVNFVLLRSLAQASYSPAHEGHFALASDDYTHFTSPIRRYPDLTIHRQLDALLRAASSKKRRAGRAEGDTVESLNDLGRHASATERRAQSAGREAVAALLVEFMKPKVGQVFGGVISSVARFGTFVQIQPFLAEGLVRLADFGPDRWIFDDRSAAYVGQRTGRVVAVGQTLRVRLVSVDDVRQELALAPESGIIGNIPEREPRPARKKKAVRSWKSRGRRA